MRSVKTSVFCGGLGFVALVCAALSTGVASATLVDYFTFDGNITDTGSNALTASSLNSAGTAITPSYVTGEFGQALSFGGTNVLDLGSGSGNTFVMSNSFTVSLWIKTISFSYNTGLISDIIPPTTGVILRVLYAKTSGTALGVGQYNNGPDWSSSTIGYSLADNNWHMVTWTYNSSTSLQSFYIDGAAAGTVTLAMKTGFTSSFDIRLGNRNNGTDIGLTAPWTTLAFTTRC